MARPVVVATLPVLIPDPEGLGDALAEKGVTVPAAVRLVDAVGYRTMLALERDAAAIVTDSSGVQVEACMVRVPCLTTRECTELLPTLASGANRLVARDPELIRAALVDAVSHSTVWVKPKRWDLAVSDRIARVLKRGVTVLV
jgi:UDP-N-acetylglucosamine 2-epimerase (non-hydrolysing)